MSDVHDEDSATCGRHEPWYLRPSDGDAARFLAADGLPAMRLIPYPDELSGVLRLCDDATGLLIGPNDRRLVTIGLLISALRGTRYHAKECKEGDFQPGAPVHLVPEPDNSYDRYAVAVWDETRHFKAAYVNKQKARLYLKRSQHEADLAAIAIRGSAAGEECPQVSVLVARHPVIRHLLTPRPAMAPTPAYLR
jgi:hypothetical protein